MNEEQFIHRVITILESNDRLKRRFAADIENFQARLHNALSQTWRLGVIGVTSSGKSTLLNALMGEALLPSIAKPSSNQLVTCHRGPERQATVYFENGKSRTFKGAALRQDIIRKYGDETVNRGNREGVRQIGITTPAFPFEPGLLLIDSPGLDAYGLESHEELTLGTLLPTIDFCIFITTCKTNSDATMKGMLDIIAQHEKPVIIVQNMIDTIKPSPDGSKSRSDVAREHLRRLERVVEASAIRDKAAVEIVQVSAILAMHSAERKEAWARDSHFAELTEVIGRRFNEVKPLIAGNRLSILKAEVERIARECLADARGTAGLREQAFEYAELPDFLEASVTQGIREAERQLEAFVGLEREANDTDTFSEARLEEIRERTDAITAALGGTMSTLNARFAEIAGTLNVDSRDIFANFSVSAPELRMQRKTVSKKVRIPGERLWYTLWLVRGEDRIVYTTEVEDDHEATRKAARERLGAVRQNYVHALGKWQDALSRIRRRLAEEIENRRRAHELRRREILDAREALKVGEALREAAAAISCPQAHATAVRPAETAVPADAREARAIPALTLHILALSRELLKSIRFALMAKAFPGGEKRRILLAGKDEDALAEFRELWFPARQKLMTLPGARLAALGRGPKDLFLLVQASQPGMAEKEAAALNLSQKLRPEDRLILVVQDMEEIINGGSLPDLMESLAGIRRAAAPGCPVHVFLHHRNPLVPLAALELQSGGGRLHRDETALIHALSRKFAFLWPPVAKIIPTLLRQHHE